MWLNNLKELKKEKKLSTKQLAEKANLPIKTVSRILEGTTVNPYIDTLDRLAIALGCTIGDILADTKAVIGDNSLATLQKNIEAVETEKETVEAQKDIIAAENAILRNQVAALTAENELLKMKLLHKEELLAVHNYYTKLKSE